VRTSELQEEDSPGIRGEYLIWDKWFPNPSIGSRQALRR
jgi:hypothetical protein